MTARIQIEIVTASGRDASRAALAQAFALRHRIFVETRGWDFLRRGDGLDRDDHDDGEAVHVLALAHGETVGHIRIIPGGYLAVARADAARLREAAGDARIDGLSRYCLAADLRAPLREAVAVRLFAATLRHVVDRGRTALLFDTDPSIILMLRALGFSLLRVGEPASIAGRLMEPVVLQLESSVLSALPMRIAAWRNSVELGGLASECLRS